MRQHCPEVRPPAHLPCSCMHGHKMLLLQAVVQHVETICTQVDRLLASHAIWVSEHSCLTEALLTAAARGTQGPLQGQVQPSCACFEQQQPARSHVVVDWAAARLQSCLPSQSPCQGRECQSALPPCESVAKVCMPAGMQQQNLPQPARSWHMEFTAALPQQHCSTVVRRLDMVVLDAMVIRAASVQPLRRCCSWGWSQ